MKITRYGIWLIGCVLLAAGCKPSPKVEPAIELPPETQVGANTFGCRFNGKAWIPQDVEPGQPKAKRPPFEWSYDPGYAGGNLNITALNYRQGG